MITIFFYSSYFGGGYEFSLNLLASSLLSMESLRIPKVYWYSGQVNTNTEFK